jgi:hypothetical protein
MPVLLIKENPLFFTWQTMAPTKLGLISNNIKVIRYKTPVLINKQMLIPEIEPFTDLKDRFKYLSDQDIPCLLITGKRKKRRKKQPLIHPL